MRLRSTATEGALALFMLFLIEMGIEIGIECLNECLIEGHITRWELIYPLIGDKK